MKAPVCLICGGSEASPVFDEFGVEVLRCPGCGHVFSSWDADPDYEGYWGEQVRKPGEAFWREAHGAMYEDFFRLLVREPKGRLLDVGCGLGFFVREMQQRFPAWESHGYEISPAAVRYGRETLGIANLHAGRVEDSGFPPASFDLVTLWDVLEHLRDPEPMLGYLRGRLVPGGACFLHTPNVRVQLPKAKLRRRLRGMQPGGHYLEARDHLHLYSPRTLRTLLERNGFAEIRFVHLHPIQNVFGVQARAGRVAKNLWFHAARGLHRLSGGTLNLDNLFAVARRR